MVANILSPLVDSQRLATLRGLHLLDTPPEEAFDRLTRLAARILEAPVGLVSLVDGERQFFKSCVGLPEPYATERQTPLSYSFCQHVVVLDAPLVIEDAREYPLVKDNPVIAALGVIAYVGVPLRTRTGQVLGSLCVIDTRPRLWTEAQIAVLNDLAAAVMTEIELREQAAALRQSHTILNTVIEGTSDGIFVKDQQGTYVMINAAGAALLGHSAADVLGQDDYAFFLPDDVAAITHVDQQIMTTGEPHTYEAMRGNGDVLCTYLTTKTAYRDDQGQSVGVIGITRDISERKTAEEMLRRNRDELEQQVAARTAELMAANAQLTVELNERLQAEDGLRSREKRFRALVQNASDIITILGSDGTILYESPAIERVLGFRPEDLVGQSAFAFVHPDDCAKVIQAFTRGVEKPDLELDLEFRFRHQDGSWRLLEAVGTNLLHNPAVAGIVVNCRDITERRSAEEALRASETQFRSVIQAANDAIVSIDERGNIISWNNGAHMIFGYTEAEVIGQPFTMIVPEDSHAAHRQGVERVVAAGATRLVGKTAEVQGLRKDGREFPMELSLASWKTSEATFFSSVIRDITERKQAEEALRASETSLANAQRVAHLGSWTVDLTTRNVMWSDELYRINGFAPQAFVPTLSALMEGIHPDDRVLIEAARAKGSQHNLEFRIVRPDGEVRVVHDQTEIIPDEQGQPRWIIGTVHDITERKALENQLLHQAFHDPLTGLPNRVLFMQRLEHALARDARKTSTLAVLFLDVDRFKVINDSLGHEVGDQLLRIVADRLDHCIRPGDTLARFGGDEFTILLEDIDDLQVVPEIAERMLRALQEPITLGGQEVFVDGSIGIALRSSPTSNGQTLLLEADIAMYRAKQEGKGRYVLFDTALSARAKEQLELETALRHAIEREEFRVFYQPIVRLETGMIDEVEALVRWQHPQQGLVSPAVFIPLAEETGLILQIGLWVLEHACRQVRDWHHTHPAQPPLTLSVNLSARQFQHPTLVADIARILHATEFPVSSLKLEITESVMMRDAEAAAAMLHELKHLGVQLAIDDFGTGYSSLAYLQRFPIDVLKVDRSFVARLSHNAEATAIVNAIITLAKTLNLVVTGEGIETADQLAQLRALGCDFGQGYYFAKPLSGDVLGELLTTGPMIEQDIVEGT